MQPQHGGGDSNWGRADGNVLDSRPSWVGLSLSPGSLPSRLSRGSSTGGTLQFSLSFHFSYLPAQLPSKSSSKTGTAIRLVKVTVRCFSLVQSTVSKRRPSPVILQESPLQRGVRWDRLTEGFPEAGSYFVAWSPYNYTLAHPQIFNL